MKSNRGTKRGCVWNNNTCCHWAGDASPRTCRTLCANRLRKSKRTTLIRMKGLVAGLPAAQHTHSQRCAAASQCVVALCLVCLSSLLLEEQEAVLDYFQREDKGAGRVRVSRAPPEFIGGFVCVLRSVWVWSSEIRVCCQHHPQTQKPKRWQPGQYLHMWSNDFLPQTTKTGSNRCKNVREGFMSRRQNKRLLFYVSAVPLNNRCHA